jgi:hypothetical protein
MNDYPDALRGRISHDLFKGNGRAVWGKTIANAQDSLISENRKPYPASWAKTLTGEVRELWELKSDKR